MPEALAIASIVVLALVHDYFFDGLSTSFLDPKRRFDDFDLFVLVFMWIEQNIYE